MSELTERLRAGVSGPHSRGTTHTVSWDLSADDILEAADLLEEADTVIKAIRRYSDIQPLDLLKPNELQRDLRSIAGAAHKHRKTIGSDGCLLCGRDKKNSVHETSAGNGLPSRRHRLPAGECKACDSYREQGIDFHPPHDASDFCPCGCARGAPNERSHCSCDTCF